MRIKSIQAIVYWCILQIFIIISTMILKLE